MNLSEDKQPPKGRNAGAVPVWGPAQAAPATSLTVGAVGFGPAWQDDDDDGWVQLTEKGRQTVADSMAASIVRLEQEREESNARIAVLEEQARILAEERDEARLQYRSTEALGMALVKTIDEMKDERAELKATIESLRDQLCADKCRDKAAADGNWVNC